MQIILKIRIQFFSILLNEAKETIFSGVFEKFVGWTSINIQMANKNCCEIQKFIFVCSGY